MLGKAAGNAKATKEALAILAGVCGLGWLLTIIAAAFFVLLGLWGQYGLGAAGAFGASGCIVLAVGFRRDMAKLKKRGKALEETKDGGDDTDIADVPGVR